MYRINSLLFLFLFIFLTELTVDSSTAFVRSNSTAEKIGTHSKLCVDSSSHAALPIIVLRPQFWLEPNAKAFFREIRIPFLTPPFARIERPPIV